MTNKERRSRRTMRDFIAAATEIMREEGVGGITIRNVADKAGYNSATLYNYFDNLEHLVCFAAINSMREYFEVLYVSMESQKTSLERYIVAWRCFCHFSLRQPRVFYMLYGGDSDALGYFEKYYTIYPEEVESLSDELQEIIFEDDFGTRRKNTLEKCIADGYFYEQDLEDIFFITELLWTGLIVRVLNENDGLNADQAYQLFCRHFEKVLLPYLAAGKSWPVVSQQEFEKS